MRIFKLILIILSLTATAVLAEDKFSNKLQDIFLNKNSVGKPEIMLKMDKKDDVRILRREDLEYVILLPETSSAAGISPKLDRVNDVIEKVEIKTQPYVGNIKGYTKVTIRTSKPVTMSARAVLEFPKANEVAEKPNVISKISQSISEKTAKTPAKKDVAPQKQAAQQAQSKKPVTQPQKPVTAPVTAQKPQAVTLQTSEETTAEQPKSDKKPVIQLAQAPKASYQPKKEEQSKAVSKPKQEERPVTQPKPVEKAVTQQPPVKQPVEDVKVTEPENTENNTDFTENKDNFTENNENIVQNEAQNTEQKPEPQKTQNVQNKSLFKSLLITGILLLLLLFIKIFNRKNNQKVINNVSEEQAQQNTQEAFTPPQNYILPFHEISRHRELMHELPEQEPEIPESTEIQEEVPQNTEVFENTEQSLPAEATTLEQEFENQEQENQEQFNTPPNFDIGIELDESDMAETEPENVYVQEETEPEPLTEDDLQTFEDHFDEGVSPDDVFGVFEENNIPTEQTVSEQVSEQQEPEIYDNIAAQESIAINNPEPQILPEQEPEIVQNSVISEPVNVPEYIEPEELPATEISETEEVVQTNETEEMVEDDEVQQTEEEADDDDVIQSSFDFTPTKSIYLVNYEGSSVLMAAIKDEYSVIKKFDEIIDKPLIVRQTEKTSKKSTYIVRAGSFRGVFEVTMKNIEMVLEL